MSFKTILFSMSALLVSSVAFADTFYCELDFTTDGRGAYISYEAARERSATVNVRPFECRGKLQANGRAEVVLLSTETSEFKSSKDGQVSMYGLDIRGNSQEHALCRCGLM